MDPRDQQPEAAPPPASSPPVPAWHAVVPDPSTERPARPSPLRAILLGTGGIVLAVVLGLTVSTRVGALAVAGTLVVAGAWRALAPDGPPGLVVRSRGFDVLLCWAAAGAITFLAFTAPGVG